MEGIIALPPPPDPPYDIEKRRGLGGVLDAGEAGARRVSPPGGAGESNMEPLAAPSQWGWTDEAEAPPAEWWCGKEPAWKAPELVLDEDRVLVLDATQVPATAGRSTQRTKILESIPSRITRPC